MNALSPQAERLFVRLIMKADDYGRFTANPKLIRSLVFPLLSDQVREADCTRWLAECDKAGLIALYRVEDKPLLVIRNFGQRMRESRPKYPPPPDNLGDCGNSPQSAATCGNSPPLTDTDSETESKTDAETKPAVGGVPPVLDTPEFRTTWERFRQHRKEIRHALTPTSEASLLAKLAKWGTIRAIEAVEQSIAHGWQGVFEPKSNGHAHPESGEANKQAALEHMRRMSGGST